MTQAMAPRRRTRSVAAVRSRALAAIALYDQVPQTPQRELERIVRVWWEKETAPALKAGKSLVGRDDAYALWELLHAIRDNTIIDLRESCRQFFKDFPIEHLISPTIRPSTRGPIRSITSGHDEAGGAGPDARRTFARGRPGDGRVDVNCGGEPGAAGLADARQFHAPGRARRAVRVPVGQSLPARG